MARKAMNADLRNLIKCLISQKPSFSTSTGILNQLDKEREREREKHMRKRKTENKLM